MNGSLWAQEIEFVASNSLLENSIKTVIAKILGPDQLLPFQLDDVKFTPEDEISVHAGNKTDIIQKLLHLDLSKSFKVDLQFKNIKAPLKFNKLSLKLDETTELKDEVLLPATLSIDLSAQNVRIGEVNVEPRKLFKESNAQFLEYSRILKVAELAGMSQEEKLLRLKFQGIRACLEKHKIDLKKNPTIKSVNHHININHFVAKIKVLFSIKDLNGKSPLLSIEKFEYVSKLNEESFDSTLDIHLDHKNIPFENVLLVNSPVGSPEVYCSTYNFSQEEKKALLTPAVDHLKVFLREQLAFIISRELNQRLLPKLKPIELENIYKKELKHTLVPEQSYQNIFLDALQNSIEDVISTSRLRKIAIDKNKNLHLKLLQDFSIKPKTEFSNEYTDQLDNTRKNYYFFSPLLKEHELKNDFQYNMGFALLANLIDYFDQFILKTYVRQFPELVDNSSNPKGRELITLKNHRLILEPIGDSKMNVGVILDMEPQLFKNMWKKIFPFPTEEMPDADLQKSILVGFDLELTLKEEYSVMLPGKRALQLVVKLPRLKDLFKSKYTYAYNYSDSTSLKAMKKILEGSLCANDFYNCYQMLWDYMAVKLKSPNVHYYFDKVTAQPVFTLHLTPLPVLMTQKTDKSASIMLQSFYLNKAGDVELNFSASNLTHYLDFIQPLEKLHIKPLDRRSDD
jgi:hypothetical protein